MNLKKLNIIKLLKMYKKIKKLTNIIYKQFSTFYPIQELKIH